MRREEDCSGHTFVSQSMVVPSNTPTLPFASAKPSLRPESLTRLMTAYDVITHTWHHQGREEGVTYFSVVELVQKICSLPKHAKIEILRTNNKLDNDVREKEKENE